MAYDIISISCFDCGAEVGCITFYGKSSLQEGDKLNTAIENYLQRQIVLCEKCTEKMKRI